LFQAGRVSKPTDGSVSSEQQSVSDQAVPETQNLIMGDEPATEESNTNVRSMEKLLAPGGQNALTSSSATSSSSASSDSVISVRTEQANSASNISDSAKTSQGVVIRPVTTTSESSGKEYGFSESTH